MAKTIAPRRHYPAVTPPKFQSSHAETGCRVCGGTGIIIERPRLYGDAPMAIGCDCYDQKAAQREHEEYLARHAAEIREADDLMSEAHRDDVDQTIAALSALRTFLLVCVIVPAVGFVAVKGIANVADVAEASEWTR